MGVVFASPGPQAPAFLYRADTRTPEQIIGTVERKGVGFVTWAQTRHEDPPNYDVLAYLSGTTVSPGEYHMRTAGWVSAAGNLEGVQAFLNQEFLHRGEGQPDYWVYQIEPTNRAYNVNWVLEEYTNNPPASITTTPANIQSAQNLLALYATEDEWMIQDGISMVNIVRATLYRFNPNTARYEETDIVRQNPHFTHIDAPAPHAENTNPMIMYPPELTPAEPTTVAYYDHSPSYEPSTSIWDGIDPEFITPDLLYIDSCASIGAYLPPPMRKRSINKVSDEMVHKALPPVAPGCDYTDNAVRKKNL
ncbi:enterotoxin A family protein [Piscirickettsia salmonis]|uniref:enterotoxin A family protein n=1 Tax=Piscirickettsia salmonis TaxID=1238 RepID=UPI001E60D19F|nr:enterotoxin A family protein [Piscirickettsia salmonis]